MIDDATRAKILDLTTQYWRQMAKFSDEFQRMATGKEVGHKIADFVDMKTTEELGNIGGLVIRFEAGAQNLKRKRSMGDLWIQANGAFNPVNIKAGVFNQNGQPNIVALNKLLRALTNHEIDSYDLLIVKISSEIVNTKVVITPHVYFVDILDYLDYVAFDAGPGQLMLKEREFYAAIDNGIKPPKLDLEQKVQRLVATLEDGHARLIANRARTLKGIVDPANNFKPKTLNQEGLRLHVDS
jgi:hypothetical protein